VNEIPELQALAGEFERALGQLPGRRRRPVRPLAAVVLAAAAGFASAVVVLPDSSQASIPLTLVNGKLVISFEQVAEDRAGVEQQIAAAGLDIDIVDVPASPSMVGHVAYLGRGEGPSGDETIDHPLEPLVAPSCADDRYCAPWWPPETSVYGPQQGWQIGILVPLDFDGFSQVWVGQAAGDHEPYRLEAKSTAPGEVLGCRQVLLHRVADVRRRIADLDVTVYWRLNDRVDPRPGDPEDPNIAPQDLDLFNDLIVEDTTYGFSEATPHDPVLWIRRADPAPESPEGRAARLAYEAWVRRTANTDTC
jgi:hypothetical protein